MSTYLIALGLHIVGAWVFFVALGMEWIGLWKIRSAKRPDRVPAGMKLIKMATKAGFVSMLTTVLSGIYMMLKVWGPLSWIITTMGALVVVIGLSLALTRPRMAAIGRALTAEKGPVLQTINSLASHPLLWISIQTRVAIFFGILFLKNAKPDLGGSLVVIGAAMALGLASSLPVYLLRRAHVQVGSAG
jgi:hypothetical protein